MKKLPFGGTEKSGVRIVATMTERTIDHEQEGLAMQPVKQLDSAATAFLRLSEAMGRFAGSAAFDYYPIAEGMTNHVWKVRVADGENPVIVQVLMDAADAESIGIVRELQYTAARIGDQIGISPRMLACYPDIAVVISEFIAGSSFPGDASLRERAVADIAHSLRTLHDVEPRDLFFNEITVPMKGTRLLIERARAANPVMFDDFAWVIQPADVIEDAYDGRPHRLIHNDLTESNVIVGDVTRLIDWEYCGLGDPYSDLGDFAGKCDLTNDEEVALITAYSGEYTVKVHAWLRAYRYINVLREGLWAMGMTKVGKANSDYDAYARRRFDQVANYIATPEFVWALGTLQGRLSPR
jgi:thiamine kinase